MVLLRRFIRRNFVLTNFFCLLPSVQYYALFKGLRWFAILTFCFLRGVDSVAITVTTNAVRVITRAARVLPNQIRLVPMSRLRFQYLVRLRMDVFQMRTFAQVSVKSVL